MQIEMEMGMDRRQRSRAEQLPQVAAMSNELACVVAKV